ncbi:MAG: hypothetical protein GY859_03990 [Desulfobacterales bacterium]|nr:hypothetical protein [Desulfobacterales bacterium]
MQRETTSSRAIRSPFVVWIQALLLVLLAQCGHAPPEEQREGSGIPVTFFYVDSTAGRVCVAGGFNQWSKETHCMTRENGRWTALIYLPPGRCAYLFVVDDRVWLPDPDAPFYEDSGFDSKNSVVIVE